MTIRSWSRLRSIVAASAIGLVATPVSATHPSPPSASDAGQGRLGVQVSNMTPELRRFFGAPQEAGLLVQRVGRGTPAERAKVAVGDVIIEIDGDAVADATAVDTALNDRGRGEQVVVVVVRKKKRVRLRVELDDDRR